MKKVINKVKVGSEHDDLRFMDLKQGQIIEIIDSRWTYLNNRVLILAYDNILASLKDGATWNAADLRRYKARIINEPVTIYPGE